MTTKPVRIGIVAGEPSGDVLAAGLIRELKLLFPNAVIEGIGGENMQAQGCESLFDMESLSVMGLVEVLTHLPSILKIKNKLIEHFTANPPDVYIGVDAPDFNLRVEAELKRRGIKTVHYVSPTVWAWREKRIHKIAKATNLVLGLFPFEHIVYDRYKVPYSYVGHTMADIIPFEPDQIVAREALQIDSDTTMIAVLPGSRGGEVKTLLPSFTQTIKKVLINLPDAVFYIPAVNHRRYEQIDEYLRTNVPDLLGKSIYLRKGQAREVMIASDAILLASGTATLEAMLCKRPMVAAYKLAPLTYRIMQRIYKAKYFSLPNLLADERIIPELLQGEVNPNNMARYLLHFLKQDNRQLIEKFTDLHRMLKQDADKQAAKAVAEVIYE
ncbi:lipid-A-disaccharide synthase [Alteromonas sp. ASW11-130]|uniref:lipid-A-disaccharide synthase n=1 Tax=Alteromonas sp. ASW11-130 TaxID=3015775 RepID=UPI0022425094|nr:lipid-A-disaccharide synthase [Alteromonas sp. ASW11-130]MCW8091658.1 lipid-A-disaccharide synthase [Alteromonas sp. ASW11-130]